MEYVALMGWFFFIFAQQHRDSKSDFSQAWQLLLSCALWGEADLLQVPTIYLCDGSTVLFTFCLELPSWYGHHSTGHRNVSQFRVAFSSPFLLSSQAQHTHDACKFSAGERHFWKVIWVLYSVDGKKCLSSIETRAVSVAQNKGITVTLHKVTLKVLGLPGV